MQQEQILRNLQQQFNQQQPQHQQQQFNDDEWEDEDEFYVVMENKHFESTELLRACKKYSISGFESDTPIVKMDNLVFKGAYDEIMGTALIFEHKNFSSPDQQQQQQQQQQQPSVNSNVKLAYKCKTEKALNIDRIIVKAKTTPNQQAGNVNAQDVRQGINAEGLIPLHIAEQQQQEFESTMEQVDE